MLGGRATSDPIVTFDEEAVRDESKELVRRTVEDTLNALLEEKDDLIGAARYKRRETSVEEAMIEMYLAGVSARRIEDVSEILRDASVSVSTVSNINDKALKAVEEWGSRPPP